MIAEKLTTVENIFPLQKEKLKGGIFLCLFGTDKTPPHLGIIANGNYYSTSAKGCRINEKTDLIIRKVEQSCIPSLFLELKMNVNPEKLASLFKKYPKLSENQTCLLPIKDYIISEGFAIDSVNFVYELIPFLKEKELIINAFSLNMNASLFELKIYTKVDITNRIVNLQETC